MESISAAMASSTVFVMHFYFIVIHLYATCVVYYVEFMVHGPPPRPFHTSKSPQEEGGYGKH